MSEVLESYIFIALYLAHHGDGVYLPQEDEEIRRLAGLAGVHDVEELMQRQDEALHQGADTFDRNVQVIAEQPLEDRNAIFHHLAEVVKSDDFIADGESELVARLREAWGLPPPEERPYG